MSEHPEHVERDSRETYIDEQARTCMAVEYDSDAMPHFMDVEVYAAMRVMPPILPDTDLSAWARDDDVVDDHVVDDHVVDDEGDHA